MSLSDNPEDIEEFYAWKDLLEKWNARINLVSRAAMADYWGRHARDSWQLWPLVPENTRNILDLGSGAGFPGIALAIGCKYANQQMGQNDQGVQDDQSGQGAGAHQAPHMSVTLVESAGKKANFLKTVIRALDLPATVHAGRAEDLAAPEKAGPYDLITARAFAPLPRLLGYAHPFWGPRTQALLLKGQSAAQELTEAQESWLFHVKEWPSHTDPEAAILLIKDLQPKEP